jgi:hypothetical protein
MEQELVEMSKRERDVLKVMSVVLSGERTQVEAARLLKLSDRQIRRIQRRLEKEGDKAVVHRLRGRPSNRRIEPLVRKEVLKIYREKLMGFGPLLACEKLKELGHAVHPRTLHLWLMAEKLWDKQRRKDGHRSRRERRSCFGEMVQADGSEHDWLEGRGPRMVLLGMIDDATGRILTRFYEGETTENYMDLLRRYLEKFGRPAAWYSDRDSVFRAESKVDREESVPTQFSRALEELGIELILANSPQAKGRIERLWGTCQDRWVKELRLAKVSTMTGANELLENKLLAEFNQRFTHPPASGNDAHRPLGKAYDLGAILSIQEKRVVANDYTIRFQNQVYQLLPPVWPGERGGQVVVEKRLDGTLKIRLKDKYLEHQPAAREAGQGEVPEGVAAPASKVSLSHWPIPVDGRKSSSSLNPMKGPATGKPRAGPSTVHRTGGRSGRTPALPYPPVGEDIVIPKRGHRPAPSHPWRNGR